MLVPFRIKNQDVDRPARPTVRARWLTANRSITYNTTITSLEILHHGRHHPSPASQRRYPRQ